jgi:hypothetical protein
MVSEQDLKTWRDLGKSAALEIKTDPQQLVHIEARGFLAHQLIRLVGGQFDFVRTPWRQPILKFLEHFFPIMPICRWFPPQNSILEYIGHHRENDLRVYRIRQDNKPPIVFFVEFDPQKSLGNNRLPSLYKVPKLDMDKFLQPPFEVNHEGPWQVQESNRGLWEGFCE